MIFFFLVLLGGILGSISSRVISPTTKIMPFLEANSGLFTFLALLVAAVPAYTYFVNRKKILSLESIPYVQMTFAQHSDQPTVVNVVIGNYGKLPAYDVKVEAPGFERPGLEPSDLLTAEESRKVKSISWLEKGISVLPPGREISAFYSDIRTLFKKDVLKPGIPEFYDVTITYLDPNTVNTGKDRHKVTYKLSVSDLIPISLRQIETSDEVNQMKKIVNTLDKVEKQLGKIPSQQDPREMRRAAEDGAKIFYEKQAARKKRNQQ